jgi:hypothetical protein
MVKINNGNILYLVKHLNMLKIKPLILCAALLIASCHSAPTSNECKKFHEGTFKMMFEGKLIIIKRNANKQFEYYDNSKTPASFYIKWLDDCSYTLRPDVSHFKKYPQTPKNALVTVKIVSSSPNSYHIKATSNFSSLVLDEVSKIE